ncbi:MAG: hypothetical protein J6B77_02330, partial [Clostridia bacterium]|nr:hypothetical protein [Clostridia bacterium]
GIQTKKEKKAKATDAPEKTPEELKAEEEAEEKRKRRRVPDFIHSEEEEDPEQESAEEKKEEGSEDPAAKEKDDPEAKKDAPAEAGKEPKRRYGKVMSWILSIFFTGEEFEYAKPWVIRVRMVLRCFAVLIEIMYLLFIGIVLASMFFALPMKLYDILVNVLRIGNWYLYPVISLLFLHEICNIFECARPYDREEDPAAQAATEQKKVEARLRKLLYELKKRFDSEHALRYYPEAPQTKIPEYKCKNETFRSALQHIRRMMQNASGRVVESYMECLDAICNDEHVYFASSFYSELGEYLIAYTYVRLLSGARMIFVVSDPDRRETLRTYISERLMKMTGSATAYSWRVYTADERLDQADVLIACPRDFKDGNIVSQYPGFFEEASNAIFIDADRTVALDSYLCPVMAKRLQQATDGRIRFVFLSLDLYKGFSGGSLPRFFCVERVLFFSSAQESESVSYVLWNRESKSHRVYNRFGQRPTSLECIIAQLACRYGIDGVRLITDAALEHSERKLLAAHDVELNNLYRGVADVNYMIYSDTRCNLSSAIYACTRFRGRKKSVVHIISRPYLLREYFVARAAKEEFTNRSSFIQPHVPEHAERHKLSLLRLFCDVMDDTKRSGQGLVIEEFETRMRDVISICRERGDIISSVFCKRMIECRDVSTLKLHELAAYMIAGLCDNDGYVDAEREAACLRESYGNRAKDFYIIVDPAAQDGYSLRKEKYIVFNRSREVLDRLFACNRRVELRLNDRTVGLLDTFPNRVHLEYIAGQSIVYQNAEYEIEHIAKDGHAVYLRRENIKIRNCLDTVLLRRYEIGKTEPLAAAGVLHNTRLMLEEIRVTKCRADFVGETYGFYGLTSDKQPLDFYHKDGVDGNPHVDDPHVRRITDGRVLKVEFRARMECNDGMRLLLAAVFNEFARTVFPKTYHSLAIVPVLASPLPFDEAVEPQTEIERIKALYPYLKHPNGENTETDPHRLAFYFVNDCSEDVGIFDWFYDRSGRYMQEFLVNVYSYLHWLKLRPEMNHYIYFGGTAIPECYDLEGCCTLLEGYNLLLSDHGEFNIETAGEDVGEELPERCAFCHRPMESGRYS